MSQQEQVTIYAEGKIDIHRRSEQLQQQLVVLADDSKIIQSNRDLILSFIRDCQLGKTLRGRSKKRIGPARCLKYLGILRRLSELFDKPFDQVSQADMENLAYRLENDQILSLSGRKYSEATKADIRKAIKKFWKWKDGNNRVYPEIVEWLDSSDPVKDVPALTRSEVDRMIECSGSPRDKAIVMVLFDSGARVEELLNVRLKPEHLFWKQEAGCYMIRLEYSKTKPRTISLPVSTRYLKHWLEVHPVRGNPQAQLFPMQYGALKMVVYRLGKRALGKRVTPHMLRHSSATYYANRLKNPYKLCYRYGWTMASNMVNRYLDREGILEEETAIAVKTDEITTARRESTRLQEELTLLRESHSLLESQHSKMEAELDELRSGKGILRLMMSLADQGKALTALKNLAPGKGFDVVLQRKTAVEAECAISNTRPTAPEPDAGER